MSKKPEESPEEHMVLEFGFRETLMEVIINFQPLRMSYTKIHLPSEISNFSVTISHTHYTHTHTYVLYVSIYVETLEAHSSQTSAVRVLFFSLRCLRMTSPSSLQNFRKIVRAVLEIVATDKATNGMATDVANLDLRKQCCFG